MPLLSNHVLSLTCRSGPVFRARVVSACRLWPNSQSAVHQLVRNKTTIKSPTRAAHRAHRTGPKAPPNSALAAAAKNMLGGQWNPLAKKLASKSTHSILYESPSKAFFILGCYVMGGLCLGWAGFQVYDTVLYPKYEISTWVKYSMGGTCLFMTMCGVYFAYKPFRIIHSITAVPITSANGQQSLRLRIRTGNILSRSISVLPNDVMASNRLFTPHTGALTAAEKAEEAVRSRERWARDKEMIMTLPFRQAWRGIKGFQRVIFNDDWIFVTIKGKNLPYKLDQHPAWAMEEGKALDSLIKQHR